MDIEASNSDDAYRILNVSRHATPSEIKHAYRRLALKVHPDKVCGEEAKVMAQRKFQELTRAYERILLNTMHSSGDPYNIEEPIFMGHPEGGVFIFVSGTRGEHGQVASHFFFLPQTHFGIPQAEDSSASFQWMQSQESSGAMPKTSLWIHFLDLCSFFVQKLR